MKDFIQLIKKPQVYFINLPQKTDKIYFDIFYKSGYIFDPPKLKGCIHVLEHYLVGSMNSKYAAIFLKANGSVNNEFVNFYLVSDQNKILSDLEKFLSGIYHVDFSNNKLFQYELKAIENEIIEKKNNIKRQILDQVSKDLFIKSCPYGETDIGKIKELQKFNLFKIKNFYNENFIKKEPIFFIGGNKLDKEIIKNIIEAVKKYASQDTLQSFYSVDFPKCQLPPFRIKKIKNESIKKGVYSIYVFPGFTIQQNDLLHRLALNILLKILTGVSPFGLILKLREEGIYSINDINIIGQQTGTVALISFSDNIQLIKSANIIKKHINQLKKDLIDKKFLLKIIQERKENQKAVWENNEKKYGWIINDIKNSQLVANIKVYNKILEKITPEFLKSIANQIFDWEKLNLFFVYNWQEDIKINEIKKLFIE